MPLELDWREAFGDDEGKMTWFLKISHPNVSRVNNDWQHNQENGRLFPTRRCHEEK